MDIMKILQRKTELFEADVARFDPEITEIIQKNRFLILGGGGSIGQAVTKEIFKRGACCLHVVDLSENYLVELVRDIRSSFGYTTSDFDTYCLDIGAEYFRKFIEIGNYDYVLNLSAMKHVRSENSAFSMKRMIETNLLNAINTYEASSNCDVKKYFCVSTDKAANPANFMGATKRAMELCLMRDDCRVPVSGARFANVAFSNGSLLQGFKARVEKLQPLSLPIDIERFFVTETEAGVICLLSSILGRKNEIFFPFNDAEVKLTTFKSIAEAFLKSLGKRMIECNSEAEARAMMTEVDLDHNWPVNLFLTDTAGEKPFEEFYSSIEEVKHGKYTDLAAIDFKPQKLKSEVDAFLVEIARVDVAMPHARKQYLDIFKDFVTTFDHMEAERFLNSRM